MRLHTFRARTLPEAMRRLRAELGEDAVIVASRELADGGGAQVTATVAEAPGGGEDDLAALLAPAEEADPVGSEIAAALAFHGVPAAVRGTIEAECAAASSSAAEHGQPAAGAEGVLAAGLARCLRFDPLGRPAGGAALALVGPPGAGKTATAARLAAACRLAGRPVRVLCADADRAGALEQLAALLAPLGLSPEPAADLADVGAGPPDALAIVDTTGANPFRGGEVPGLARRLAAAAADIEPVLVLPAGLDPQDAVEAVGAFAEIGARRCVVTRLDAARRFGSVVAAGATGVALAEASVSPLIGKAMPPLTPAGLARLLLRRVRRGGNGA